MWNNPIVTNFVSKRTLPKFSGNGAEWREFAQKWGDIKRMAEQTTPGGIIPDALLLDMLNECLDRGSQFKLQKYKQNSREGETTYLGFWQELERDFGRDVLGHHRSAWEGVTLRGVQALKMSKLREFQAEFEWARSLARDIAEGEEEKNSCRNYQTLGQ